MLVLVPSSLVTALFIYYGRVYAARLYDNFGVTAAGMEFTSTDHIVRGVAVLLPPIPLVIIGVVLAVGGHLILGHIGTKWRIGGWIIGIMIVGAVTIVGALMLWYQNGNSLHLALSWSAGSLLLSYGVWFRWIRDVPKKEGLRKRFGVLAVLAVTAVISTAWGVFMAVGLFAANKAETDALSTPAES